MPTKNAAQRDHRAAQPTTRASEFVRDEMHRYNQGKSEIKSRQQAIAIGLSEARRSGVKLTSPTKEKASAATRKKARKDVARGQGWAKPSPTRPRGSKKAAATRQRRTRDAI